MTFTKRLREGVRRGEITCSVRIWTRPHVKVGARYRMEEDAIEIDSIEPIGFPDITPQLAHASGFLGVLDLLKVAKHGKGEKHLPDSLPLRPPWRQANPPPQHAFRSSIPPHHLISAIIPPKCRAPPRHPNSSPASSPNTRQKSPRKAVAP
jgi:hypothetical protein